MHRMEIAAALDTNINNANNAITDALKHGLVQRVGRRSGLVELVQQGTEQQPAKDTTTTTKLAVGKKQPAKPTPRRKKRGGTSHADRLVQLLHERGEPVHLDDFVEHLGTTRPTVQEVIRHAAKAGRVRRVGSRSGLVALPEQGAVAEVAEPAREAPLSTQAPVLPASSAGLTARVVAALEARAGWMTAKDVAAALGCRPREAGNALALLVERGVVERRRDGDGPAEYRHLA